MEGCKHFVESKEEFIGKEVDDSELLNSESLTPLFELIAKHIVGPLGLL